MDKKKINFFHYFSIKKKKKKISTNIPRELKCDIIVNQFKESGI